jgi:metal-responsive CopG/Arc/MetJ family transcriptional regulator
VTTTTKVAISIPDDLYAWGEQERERLGISRSEFVARLYREHMRRVEHDARVARETAAYSRQPYTEEEDAWTEEATRTLFDALKEDPHDWSEDYRRQIEHRAAG